MARVTTAPAVPIAELDEQVRGEVVTRDHPRYDDIRRTWNAGVDKEPSAIVRCSGTADVARAIRFAREHDVPVALRSGGHSVAGFSTIDDGLVIDLSPMQGIRVDPARRTVRAQAGVTIGALDRETQEFGLATTMGVVGSVGITGLTLGGGIGWLMRKHGLASDNLLSADLVTASGETVVASAEESPDLLWGLRGGGGNLGIVTSLEFQLHPVGPAVVGGLVAYPPATTRDVLRFYREFTADAPDELTAYAAMTVAPDGTAVSAIAACYAGDLDAGERLLAPAKTIASPHIDALGPLPYLGQQALFEGAYPPGRYHYWKSFFVDELSDGLLEVIAHHNAAEPGPNVLEILIEHLGGAVAARDPNHSAFGHRDAAYDVMVFANWVDPADSDRCVAWTREAAAAVEPYSRTGGGYVNYLQDGGQEAVRAAYGERYARLQALKDRFDPDNVFRLNQNVLPSSG